MQRTIHPSLSPTLLSCIILAAVIVTAALFLPATGAAAIRDSKGTDFWITFLPNFHNQPDAREDSLYIFITAEQPASGTIVYYDIDNRKYERTFTISAGEFFIFSTVFTGFELEGTTSPNGGVNPDPQNEQAAPQVFHISSNSEVTVYGLNQARTTSDAFISLPTDVLGTEYYVVSYPSDVVPGYTPSEFAVVATEDATDITITPSVATSTGPATVRQVRLNKGQAYLVQTQSNSSLDLTGSRVAANKPVAVFAGHQRARVSQSPQSQSRDHLVEQLPPIPTWGGSAFVTPYPLANNGEPSNFDKYRVLAAFNNTDIYVDGVFFRTLNAGQYYETLLTKSEWITATGPILVTQYKKTSQRISGGGSNYSGDPFMIVNSPVEQYLNRYQCFSIMAWEDDEPDIYGGEQYLTIIAPTDSIGTVKLNGVPIPANKFRPLSITSYSYTDSLKVQTGINVVEANVGVGVYVYGYGFANSYGYTGGMKYDSIYTFDPPDIIPPLLLGTPVCDSLMGGAYDTLAFDRGIRSVTASQLLNTTVAIDSLQSPARRAGFLGRLVDPYRDGSFVISTRDSAGSGRSTQFDIPGYTVRMSVGGATLPVTAAHIRIGGTTCATITLTNDGKFPQTISQADFYSDGFTVQTNLPVVIPPGGVRTIDVCFTLDGAGIFKDTMFIGNACVRRPVTVFDVKVEAPLSSSTDVQCEEMRGVFYDTSLVKLTVDRVEVLPDSMENATVQVDPFTQGADSIAFHARLIDPFEDGRGSVVARNVAGIQGWVNFDIPGFTIHIDPVNKKPVVIDDETRSGKLYCIPVELSNYGKFERTVTSIRMKNNSPEFTVQPASVTLPPGSKTTIQLCFQTNDLGTFSDSLIIGNDCVERPVAFITILARKDTVMPAITRTGDSCRTMERLIIADSLKFDWGIASYSITDEVNCVVNIDDSRLPSLLAVDVQPVDRLRDARYRLVVVDSAGNRRDTTLVMQGFTISFLSLQSGSYPFGTTQQVRCDSIAVYNSSELPYRLTRLDLMDNTKFSAPLSQFPITIPPLDTGYVIVCFEPVDDEAASDTIQVAGNCMEAKIGVSGNSGQFLFTTESRCGVEIRLSSSSTPPETFIVQNFPNPAAEMTTFRFGVSGDGPVRVVLYNALGVQVAVLVDNTFEAGLYDVTVDLSNLESGVYFYEFFSADHRSAHTMSIIR